jgi:L-fuculose-phosphate aldolase
MKFHLLHPRDQLVAIMQRIYDNGMTTLSGGNLSIKDDNGDIWITPAGVDKGKLTPGDISCVHADGTKEGPHRPSSEYPFHRAIYAQRPDLRAIVHAHPPALVSFSIARQLPDTNIIPQAQQICGAVGYAPYALPGSEQLGANIAATFAGGCNAVLLENHGIATAGSTLLNAFQRLETLDFCARTLLKARILGDVHTLDETQLALLPRNPPAVPTFEPQGHSSRERELRQQIIDIAHRAYDRYLMISTEGVISARLDAERFLITPTGMDRRGWAIEDLVMIDNGRCEVGKAPSRAVKLHETIYRQHPQINVIMTAQSPHATAYAISTARFDSKSIPESYVLLRELPVIPFGAQYQAPQLVADALSVKTPVVLIQNDCILTTGRTVLEAFDRLEVAEFSAKALIDTVAIGHLVPIGAQEIAELEVAFALG